MGLIVSNAGGALSFFTDMLDQDREGLHRMLRLNTAAHLDIAHHFGRRLAQRGRAVSCWSRVWVHGRVGQARPMV